MAFIGTVLPRFPAQQRIDAITVQGRQQGLPSGMAAYQGQATRGNYLMHTMKRADREIKDPETIRAIMEEARVCHIGLSDDGMPYVVPMNFGLGQNCIYLHCAAEGRKLAIIRKNDRACFEMDLFGEVLRNPLACGCSARYQSVIGFGRAVIVDDPIEIKAALDRIMEHYGMQGPFTYPDASLAKTRVIRIDIASLTGKCRA
jgi:uncharacterized protein